MVWTLVLIHTDIEARDEKGYKNPNSESPYIIGL